MKKFNFKTILISSIIISLVVFFDFWSKKEVVNYFTNIANLEPISITSFFDIVLVWNKGISFGLFNGIKNSSYLFLALSLCITLILSFWLANTDKFATYSALALIIGGAIGNIIDRIKYGAVIDFIDLHVYGYSWPAFNIADSAICIGVSILLLQNIMEEIKGKKNV